MPEEVKGLLQVELRLENGTVYKSHPANEPWWLIKAWRIPEKA